MANRRYQRKTGYRQLSDEFKFISEWLISRQSLINIPRNDCITHECCHLAWTALDRRSFSLRTATDHRRVQPLSSRLTKSCSGDLRLFTFLSMRTVKTSRSLSGSLLSTSPWLNSCTGWLRRAVRLELDRPMSFPLRGCSSAAIFSGRPVFTTHGIYDSKALTNGTCRKSIVNTLNLIL